MAAPNKDELEGKYDQAKGSIKEGLGNLTGDRDLQAEGEADKASGNVQEGWGKVKRGVSETIDDIGDAISDAGRSVNK
ncbi:MAG: CsbD family protein [Pyrinomonadaceae bacterium]